MSLLDNIWYNKMQACFRYILKKLANILHRRYSFFSTSSSSRFSYLCREKMRKMRKMRNLWLIFCAGTCPP